MLSPALLGLLSILAQPAHASSGSSASSDVDLADAYSQEVSSRLAVPELEQRYYATMLESMQPIQDIVRPQFLVMVDRSEFIQAAMIFWKGEDRRLYFIGASPVSTGKPGRFDHFTTPTGIFDHTPDNPDFRALGTRNELGIRGYGRRGMRIYDFGWVQAIRGWGHHDDGTMRLQMHATDPDILEPRLGTVQSKGCIRIPASLNSFIDHYGILDGAYEEALTTGSQFWVLSKDRSPTSWSGRLLVIVDSQRTERPAWSPDPLARPRAKAKSSVVRKPIARGSLNSGNTFSEEHR